MKSFSHTYTDDDLQAIMEKHRTKKKAYDRIRHRKLPRHDTAAPELRGETNPLLGTRNFEEVEQV